MSSEDVDFSVSETDDAKLPRPPKSSKLSTIIEVDEDFIEMTSSSTTIDEDIISMKSTKVDEDVSVLTSITTERPFEGNVDNIPSSVIENNEENVNDCRHNIKKYYEPIKVIVYYLMVVILIMTIILIYFYPMTYTTMGCNYAFIIRDYLICGNKVVYIAYNDNLMSTCINECAIIINYDTVCYTCDQIDQNRCIKCVLRNHKKLGHLLLILGTLLIIVEILILMIFKNRLIEIIANKKLLTILLLLATNGSVILLHIFGYYIFTWYIADPQINIPSYGLPNVIIAQLVIIFIMMIIYFIMNFNPMKYHTISPNQPVVSGVGV
jgi:hypothetical protein